MHSKRIVPSLVLSIGCGIAIQNPVSAEEYRGTWEQRMACTPDVWRLCSDQMPDVSRIVACLRQNKPQLSNGCRAVFETSANAQPPQSAPRATQPQPVPRARPTQPVQPQPVQPRPYDDDE